MDEPPQVMVYGGFAGVKNSQKILSFCLNDLH